VITYRLSKKNLNKVNLEPIADIYDQIPLNHIHVVQQQENQTEVYPLSRS
jgi:hypothetical protein